MIENSFINHFAHPWFLAALPLPFLLLLWHLYRSSHRPAILFGDLSLARDLPKSLKQRAMSLFPWIRAFALALGVIALARPQYGSTEFRSEALGVDIALVMDVSGSMQEGDYAPNRLEAAKVAATNFVKNRVTDRISVVVFGTSAALLLPPTLDMYAAQTFIEAIQDGIIKNQSTAVGDGLALAVKQLEDSPAKSRVAILLTDGENNSGEIDPLQAAEIAKALDVRVYTIGLGRKGLPVRQFGILGVPQQSVGLGFNEEILKQIASMTGGTYFRATDEESLKSIYSEIDKMEKTELEVQQTTDYDERFMWFWFPGLGLIALEFFLRAFWVRRLP